MFAGVLVAQVEASFDAHSDCPDWNVQFELMCDASDVVVGAMLSQRHKKIL